MVQTLASVLANTFGEGGTHARDAHAVNAVLVELYPSLRKALLSLVDRLRESTDSSGGGGGGGSASDASGGGYRDSAGGLFSGSGWGDSPFASGGGGGFEDGEEGPGSFMEMVMAFRAEDEASGPPNSFFDSSADIRIAGSAELFRHHRRSGLLDDTLLRTISGAAAPSPLMAYQQQLQPQQRKAQRDGNAPAAASASAGGKGGEGGVVVRSASSTAQDEQAALLEALAPIRDRFLEHSHDVVMRPVDQMFPSMEGYANAIPSKHDVLSFMRVVQGELDRAVHGGEAVSE